MKALDKVASGVSVLLRAPYPRARLTTTALMSLTTITIDITKKQRTTSFNN